jgi:hypothetical protein
MKRTLDIEIFAITAQEKEILSQRALYFEFALGLEV